MKNILLPIAGFLIAVSPQLEAQVAPCGIATLAAYETSGPCVLGGSGGALEFSGFTFYASMTPGANPDLASDVLLTPNPEGLGGGFTYTGFGAATLGAGQSAIYTIDYTYTILGDPPTVGGADMGMDPPFGTVSIAEAICGDGLVGDCPSLSVNDTNPPASWTASITLDPPVTSFANVYTTIVLNGGESGAGFDGLSQSFDVNASTTTPEPLTSAMGLGGLLAIGVFRRYRSKRLDVR